jgi:esterase/lipase superfamily enzyme
MPTTYWMITNRNKTANGLGPVEAALSYWTSNAAGAIDQLSAWQKRTASQFRKDLIDAVAAFPVIADPGQQESEKHVTLFVHGFNNSWDDAVRRYRQMCDTMFAQPDGLGICVLFTWPSDGLKVAYYPDRGDARGSADELASVLCDLYDYLLKQQALTMAAGAPTCHAKISIIAHSMGNYLVQKAMQQVWTRKNQPLLVSLVNQLLMVAADVDNDLFRAGEMIDKSDGDAIANLTYRVTALYTGKDSTLGLSAGMKHFGKRRLGRSGLDRTTPHPDNVWEVDCSTFFEGVGNIHSAYFDVPKTRQLMHEILRGVDRGILRTQFALP